MGKFVGALPAGITEESLSDSYSDAYWKSGYKMPLDWVIKKFWATAEAVEYYVHTRNIEKGVTILSKDEYDMVLKAKELVVASPFAARYFQSFATFTELRHQVPIYFTYKKLDCKALLDGIEINHRDRFIQPFDLKTTGKNVYNFAESYITYGYYRQAAFYEQALLSEESPIKDLLLEGYELKDFIFIVAETKMSSTNPALIFVTTEQERRAGIHGGFTKDGTYHKGIDQLMWDYLWHVTNDEWTYPKDVYNSEGRVTLDVFNSKSC